MGVGMVIRRGILVSGILVGLAWSAAAVAQGEAPHNWMGSVTGTSSPGAVAGSSVDAFGGNCAPFGPFTGAGTHVLNPATGHFAGSAVWTASHGNSLNVSFTGDLTPSGNPLYPYGFKGVLKAHGGTGRLAHARGTAVWMGGFTGVPGNYFFVFDGNLEAAGGLDRGDNFQLKGTAGFTNILKGTTAGGIVPYLGVGKSGLLKSNVQTGTIRNLSGLVPIDASTFVFLGEVGPHPFLPGNPAVHLISTPDGTVTSTWTAVFTLKVVNPDNGDAVFSGDGDFLVTGGTGRYRGASGRFRTFFETGPVPHGADGASAAVFQRGKILRP